MLNLGNIEGQNSRICKAKSVQCDRRASYVWLFIFITY